MPEPTVAALQPVVALVALTLVAWLRMYFVRVAAMRGHRIPPERMRRPSDPSLPPELLESGDNFRNLCELPILYYAATFAALALGAVDAIFLAMAWTFVGLRAVHSAIHLGHGRVLHRFYAYAAGGLVLWAIWARLGWRVLAGA